MKHYLKGLRIAAFLIDCLFATVMVLILGNFISFLYLKFFAKVSYPIYIFWIFFMLLGVLYLIFKDGFNGRSIGKRITGLKVILNDEKPCNFKASFLRNFMLFLPIINFYEAILILFKKNALRLGERISKTRIEEV